MSDIRAWLEAQGLAKHADLFEANDIGTDILGELEEADLKDLGLTLGDRKRIMAALRSLGENQAGDSTAAPPVQIAARRQVTVLFADLTGFTRLSNRLDAEELHALLQRFFAEVDAAVRRFGGSIDKHIGDAVMAVFGAPVAHSDDPERAVRCALDIHTRLAAFQPAQQSHIGIASGQVLASETGSQAFTEYTVTGASVNLAARLQDLAKSGETLISDEVKRATGSVFAADAAGELSVKGIDKPVAAWRVFGLASASTKPDRPFVGRRRESAQLESLIQVCLQERRGQVAVLRGDPGIGKTRLGDRLTELAALSGFDTHKALVLDFGAAKGREAVPALLRSLLDLDPDSSAELRASALNRAVEQGLVGVENRVHLFNLLDLPQPSDLQGLNQAMTTQVRSRGEAKALSDLVLARAAERPLFLRIEDVHWAEPELIRQLGGLAAACQGAAVLLLLTTRIQGDPLDTAWRSLLEGTPTTTIDLGPLGEAAAMELARSYKVAEEDFAKNCITRAAGNPLFLDQLLQMVGESIEQGIPGSVQSIVQSRMDRLPAEDRAALEAASVLGQRFGEAALASLLRSDREACRPLLTQGLIKPEGDGYLFAHALVRDGVYATLLQERRKELHGLAAAYFRERDAALHARHLHGADDPAAAAAFLTAAEEAVRGHRLAAAQRLIDEGLALPKSRETHFALSVARGETLRDLGETEASAACYDAAMALAESAAERAQCHLGVAAAMRILDRFDDAFAALEEAKVLAGELGDKAMLAEIWSLRGNLLFPLGRPDDCQAAHAESLRIAQEASIQEAEVRAMGGLGDAYYARGRVVQAQRHFAECVAMARAGAFGRIEVANAPMLAWSTMLIGAYNEGVAEAERAWQQAKAAGNDRAAIIALNALATASSDRGDLELGEARGKEIVRLSEHLQSGRFKSYGLNLLAEIAYYRDDHQAARGLADQALAEAEASAIGFCGPWILGIRARIKGDSSEALDDLAHAEEVLACGAVAHTHFFFRRHAMEYALEQGKAAEVERQAAAFERFLDDQGTPWSDLFLRRARLLAQLYRGEAQDLERRALLDLCEAEGLAIWAGALKQ